MCKLPVPTFSFLKQIRLARPPNRHFRGQTQPKPISVHQIELLVDGLQMLVCWYFADSSTSYDISYAKR